jgi:hypothetical protein
MYQKRADAYQRPLGLATAARCTGLLHAANGDLAAATDAYRRALVLHDDVAGPFERGRTLLALGVAQRRANSAARPVRPSAPP